MGTRLRTSISMRTSRNNTTVRAATVWKTVPTANPTPTPAARQTRDCMQREAVRVSVAALKNHAQSTGAARGRIILPCGTGKSRIALQVDRGANRAGSRSPLSSVPSIALVAQLRREFLIHSSRPLVALAVCSDQTAARGSDLSKDQAADLSRASARDVKGRVTTDADEIAEWMGALPEGHMGVIFGTYQSSHKIAEALTSRVAGRLTVLVADEAHRTAGIRRVKGDNERLRDFTICHQEHRFPATYRVYQTATPKIYKTHRESATPRGGCENRDLDRSQHGRRKRFRPGTLPQIIPRCRGERMAFRLPDHRARRERSPKPTKPPTDWLV